MHSLLGATNKHYASRITHYALGMISLTNTLQPLTDHFNANREMHRFVALLSPT